jgi:hypothetical protein
LAIPHQPHVRKKLEPDLSQGMRQQPSSSRMDSGWVTFHDAMCQITGHNPAGGVITLRRQCGQTPLHRQNPGLTMPVRQTARAAVTYDANVVRNPSVT